MVVEELILEVLGRIKLKGFGWLFKDFGFGFVDVEKGECRYIVRNMY